MREKTKEQLLQEIESLKKQIAKLKQDDIAEVQKNDLKPYLSMPLTPTS